MATPRNYLASAGPLNVSFQQVWDSTGVAYGNIDSGGMSISVPISTGIWRALAAGDFAGGGGGGGGNVTVTNPILAVSGVVTTSAGNAAITGGQVSVAGGYVGLTGAPVVTITGVQTAVNVGGYLGITGVVATTSGTFSPGFSIITGSQLVVPSGYKSASVAVVSGWCYINGTGQIWQGINVGLGGYNGQWTSSTPLVVGATGSTGSPCNIFVVWE